MVSLEPTPEHDDPHESPFKQAADRLIAAGYTPIPILPRDKAPGDYRGSTASGSWTLMEGWNNYATTKPSDASIARWKTWPDANIGITLGTRVGGYVLVAIDFDTDDQNELDLLQSCIPHSRMTKRGRRGYTAFYRASPSTRTKRYMVADKAAIEPNKKRCVHRNPDRQRSPVRPIMPPSVHPSGMVYAYMTGDEIVPIGELPVLSDDHFERLEDTLEHLGWNPPPVANNDNVVGDDSNIWRETNNAALANFGVWVEGLGLPNARQRLNGYEATAPWRASNEGRPLELRKPNLKFHTTGIKDMGTDEGFTALDVVMAAKELTAADALVWLRAKLGFDDSTPFIDDITSGGGRLLVEAEDGTLSDAETGEIVPTTPSAASTSRAFPEHLTHPDGLLGEMINYIVDTAPNPSRTLALASAVCVLGTLMGRRDATPTGTGSGTHLYVLAIGPTGCGKQHPQDAGEMMLREATAERGDNLLGSSEWMSQTALVREIQTNPLRLSFVDEFGAYLKRINSKRASGHEEGIKKIMMSVWGRSFSTFMSPSWATDAGREIYAPALSIVGSSTPTAFYDAVQGDDRENGFLNRFLLFPIEQGGADREPLYDYRTVPSALSTSLRAVYRVRRQMFAGERPLPHVVPWHDDRVKAIYQAFATDCKGRGDHFKRTAEMAARLATIVAVGRDYDFPKITVQDITWGRDVALWSAERMVEDAGLFISDNDVGRDRGRIMAKLRKAGGRCMFREVMRDLSFKSNDLSAIVRDLQMIGLVEIETVKPARGREIKWLVAV